MTNGKLKVIILTHGGAIRLIELLSADEKVEIVGLFVETVAEPKRTFKQKLTRSIRYDGYTHTARKMLARLLGSKTGGAEEFQTVLHGQDDLKKAAKKLQIPVTEFENFHDDSSVELLKQANADLGILYGTNIIKEPVFSIPKLGSINIHQGLAPYYRGGPPVFWELFNGEAEVGITVHFVASAVDTGDIVLQKTVPLQYDFERYGLDHERFLCDFRAAMTEPSAKLIAEAVSFIAEGKASRKKQDTSLGKRYRLPIKSEKDELMRILQKRQKQLGQNT